LCLIGALPLGSSVAAQAAIRADSVKRVDCPGWRPSHDFRRVTSDSEQVQVLPGAPEELAQRLRSGRVPRRVPRGREDYDFVLDIPRLCVDYVELRVDSLTARVSLDANIAGMVRVVAGAGVALGHVDLVLTHVRATVLLAVDLTNVTQVVNQTMDYLDAHPDMLARVLESRIREERRARPP
jgi:hypothetical protein